VEVALQADTVAIRDSRDPDTWLMVSAAGWRSFIHDVKNGLVRHES
jgi:hypothetical protein